MRETYSTYEAKARLSEILRKVESGRTILISRHGRPVAEIGPPRRGTSLVERLEELEQRGIMVRSMAGKSNWQPIERRPGALRRFMEERGA